MTADQILQQNLGPRYPQIRNALALLQHQHPEKYRYVQFGDTLFLCSFQPDGSVAVNMETRDPPQLLVRDIKRAAHSLASQGHHRVLVSVSNPMMLRVMQMLKLPFQKIGPNQYAVDIRGA